MATSLVSTGVQFPDSTIQTTAAGASALKLLSTVTASSSSTVELETGIGSTYDFYLITVSNVTTDANGIFKARLKVDGSYNTSAYYGSANGGYSGGGNYALAMGGDPALYTAISYISSTSGSTLSGEFWFSNPTSTSVYKTTNWVFSGLDATSPSAWTTQGAGGYMGSTSALTGVRFYFTTGSIVTGTFRLYGFSKT